VNTFFNEVGSEISDIINFECGDFKSGISHVPV